MSTGSDAITLVQGAIHNPAEPRHFMRVVALEHVAVATIGAIEIARSSRALKVKEVGHDIYDPVLYFPRADVAMALLVRTSRSTHCPLKGDTAYFDVTAGASPVVAAAWSYESTIPRAAALQDYIAFDTRRVAVRECSAGL